jgi:hypothetical protein
MKELPVKECCTTMKFLNKVRKFETTSDEEVPPLPILHKAAGRS